MALSLEEFVLALLTFWLAITLILSLVRLENVDYKPFFVVVKGRPRLLRRLLKALSSRWGRAWIVALDVGVAMGVGMMAFSLYFLAANLVRRFLVPREFVAVMPPIPGLLFPLEVLPHFIAALAVAVVIHEAAHALASKLLGVKVKGAGVALAVIILAAFVELDEEGIKRVRLRDKLRIFTAGPSSNMLLFLLVVAAFTVVFQPGGVLVQRVEPGTPADRAGLTRYSVIVALNGTSITDSLSLHRFMLRTRPNQTIVIDFIEPTGARTRRIIRAASHPYNRSIGFIGILPADYYELRLGWLPPSALIQVHLFLLWLEIVLFSLAVFNMLPISIADGGRVFRAVVEEVFKGDEGKVKAFAFIANSLCLGLIVANVAVTILAMI